MFWSWVKTDFLVRSGNWWHNFYDIKINIGAIINTKFMTEKPQKWFFTMVHDYNGVYNVRFAKLQSHLKLGLSLNPTLKNKKLTFM